MDTGVSRVKQECVSAGESHNEWRAQMTYRIAFRLLALAVASGCGGKDATSPLASRSAVAVARAGARNVGATSQRSGSLNVTKNCSAYHGLPGEYCTITSSSMQEIPVGSLVVY